MKTDGHYDLTRKPHGGEIVSIDCAHCSFSVLLRPLFRNGDRSGQGRYNRARAMIVKHLHAAHRLELANETPSAAMAAESRE